MANRNAPIKKVETEITVDEEIYPYSFSESTIPLDFTGLRVLSVPFKRDPVPQLIRFPIASAEITIGSSPGLCTLALEPWDKPRTRKTGGLYSPHAFIGNGKGGWYIRSSHGGRRGNRAITLNGCILTAYHGNVLLPDASELCLGDFRFRVVISAINLLDAERSDNLREALAEAEHG